MASYSHVKRLSSLAHYDYFFNSDGTNKPHRGGFAAQIELAAKEFKAAFGKADSQNQFCMALAFGEGTRAFLSFCYNHLPQDVSNGVVAFMLLGYSPAELLTMMEDS